MNSMLGKKQQVLIEKVNNNGAAHGYGEHYLPVSFSSPGGVKNTFEEIILEQVDKSGPPTMLASMSEGN